MKRMAYLAQRPLHGRIEDPVPNPAPEPMREYGYHLC